MSQKVLMVGSWHLGSVIGACLAEAGNQVHLWDQSPQIAEKWVSGHPPIHEPGLDDLVKKFWQKNLFWSDQPQDSASVADWICLTYDTPINEKDEVQLGVVEEGLKKVLNSKIKENCHFFFTSQLPVGTSRRFLKEIKVKFPKWKGHVLYQPENLRLGEAITSFQKPDRMVLGLDDVSKKTELALRFQTLTANKVTPINLMTLESAEMVKHALNSFLATCVVFANEISEICERQGADAWDVVASLKQDSRVGPKAFLRPGLGFSGGTLARDVMTLSQMTQKDPNNNLFKHLYHINNLRNEWVINQLEMHCGNLDKKKIVLLGVTYKPGTSTVRRSPALEIGRLLLRQGAKCVALDPMADLKELSPSERANLSFTLEKDSQGAFKGADGAIVVTEWRQFKEYNWAEIGGIMKNPLIVDSKNLLEKTTLGSNFKHIVPGRPE